MDVDKNLDIFFKWFAKPMCDLKFSTTYTSPDQNFFWVIL